MLFLIFYLSEITKSIYFDTNEFGKLLQTYKQWRKFVFILVFMLDFFPSLVFKFYQRKKSRQLNVLKCSREEKRLTLLCLFIAVRFRKTRACLQFMIFCILWVDWANFTFELCLCGDSTVEGSPWESRIQTIFFIISPRNEIFYFIDLVSVSVFANFCILRNR